MKILLSLLLTFSLLLATSVDKKIKEKQKQLSAKKVQYKKMDKQLSIVAKKILTAKANQDELNIKLATLEKKIKNNETTYIKLKKDNDALVKKLNGVTSSIDEKQFKFVELISKKFSMALALEEFDRPTSESVMTKEVYKVYAKKNKEDINVLKKDIIFLESKKEKLAQQQSNIKKAISGYVEQRQEYKNKKIQQDKLVKELARDKAIYKKCFNNIKASRNKLANKLASLKIIKSNAKKAAVAKANRAKEAKTVKSTTHQVKIAKYNKGKTISPLKGARLIKKFGSYIDPIYKFKIFNKSVTLKAPHSGSKVKSVLPGKIVFAENSGGMLGKVVIVEHANSIHTIYAKLSRLAPGTKVGKRLSKGSIIGKVDKSLMFEVTKNNKHMNPMNLIRL